MTIQPVSAGDPYDDLMASVRGMLDDLAAARLDDAAARALIDDVDALRGQLAAHAVDESEQVFGRRPDLLADGQTMVPAYVVREADRDSMRATITFGRYHLGRNGAAHGGAIASVFENLVGQLAGSGGRPFGRAAYAHVDFRAITPIERQLELHAWFVSETGRKRLVRADLRDGDVVCAEAEGLVIELRAGQA